MPNENKVEGMIVELLPGNLYKVQLDGSLEILAYLAGKMRFNKIRVIVGDRVVVVLDPYKGKTTNRIEKRL